LHPAKCGNTIRSLSLPEHVVHLQEGAAVARVSRPVTSAGHPPMSTTASEQDNSSPPSPPSPPRALPTATPSRAPADTPVLLIVDSTGMSSKCRARMSLRELRRSCAMWSSWESKTKKLKKQ